MTNLSKRVGLLRGMLTGDKAYVGPFAATVDLTRRCNLRCPGCRFHSTKIDMPGPGDQRIRDLNEETFKIYLNELKEMGTEYLVLTGDGEPFLHPRLLDFIDTSKDAGLKVTLFTNGTLLDKRRLRGLVDKGLDTLRVSLWASSEEEYKLNYPETKPETFKKIINSLTELSKIKKQKGSTLPLVSLHRPIGHDNYKGVEAMAYLAHRTGANKVSFSPFKTRRRALTDSALSPAEEKDLKNTLQKMKKKSKSLFLDTNVDQTLMRYDIGETVWEKLPCYMGWIHIRIKVDGTVLPCNACSTPVGSLNENTLAEIWNSKAMKNFRNRTITREGLKRMSKSCDCGFCCHVGDNVRIHKFYRCLSPFRSKSG